MLVGGNPRFLMIALAYAIPLGVFSGWSGVLDWILTPAHVSQVDAGWIGFWSIVGGCVFGIALARPRQCPPGVAAMLVVAALLPVPLQGQKALERLPRLECISLAASAVRKTSLTLSYSAIGFPMHYPSTALDCFFAVVEVDGVGWPGGALSLLE
ncbi:UNVERIFIED_CONTAM: hypothetical protein K2H54_019966 [Gekko kuhli]